MRFIKYHGLANDFILVTAQDLHHVDRPGRHPPLDGFADIASAWCARHRGVGADGVLIAVEPDPEALEHAACWRMIIFNADGSRPEMCGNGLRCFARWLVEEGHVSTDTFAVLTDAGVRTCTVAAQAMAAPWQVEIDLGAIEVASSPELLEVGTASLMVLTASAGNPHAIVQLESATTRQRAEEVGAALCHHPRFPARTNAEFAYLRADGSIELTVFERGCGITQACGTGAAATAAVFVRHGQCPADTWIALDLPGGRCLVLVPSASDQPVRLRGPATRVYEGTLDR